MTAAEARALARVYAATHNLRLIAVRQTYRGRWFGCYRKRDGTGVRRYLDGA